MPSIPVPPTARTVPGTILSFRQSNRSSPWSAGPAHDFKPGSSKKATSKISYICQTLGIMAGKRPLARGMRAFSIIWSGQVVSMCGSALSSFAVGVWVYQKTGSATQFALIALFASLPGLLLAPLAGALLDRFDRRALMLLADCGSGLASLGLALLLWAGALEVWQVYLIVAINRSFDSLKL